MRLVAGIFAAFIVMTSTSVQAYTTVLNVKVTKLAPRTGSYTVPAGTKGFFFAIDASYVNPCAGPSPTFWYGIDQSIPSVSAADNIPQYRDAVTTVQMAFALDKTVTLYVDGCVGGFSRIVGIDVAQ